MRHILSLLLFAAIVLPSAAQTETVPAPDPRPSPLMLAKTQIGDTYVKIHYSSPQRRNPTTGEIRQIFGSLVPYGQVWRTGANESTEITLTGDLMMGSAHVPAGTYAVYTIPGESEWTIILSRAVGQWGAFSYDESMDFARFKVPSSASDKTYEAFTISFEEMSGGANMVLTWENTSVRIPLVSHG